MISLVLGCYWDSDRKLFRWRFFIAICYLVVLQLQSEDDEILELFIITDTLLSHNMKHSKFDQHDLQYVYHKIVLFISQ